MFSTTDLPSAIFWSWPWYQENLWALSFSGSVAVPCCFSLWLPHCDFVVVYHAHAWRILACKPLFYSSYNLYDVPQDPHCAWGTGSELMPSGNQGMQCDLRYPVDFFSDVFVPCYTLILTHLQIHLWRSVQAYVGMTVPVDNQLAFHWLVGAWWALYLYIQCLRRSVLAMYRGLT